MKQSELLRFFHKDLFIPALKATDKDGVLKELAACLESEDKLYKTSLVYDLLKRREDLGSTGIGGGIAIPHCRSIAVRKLTVLCALKPQGVDFKAADAKPVKLFFLVVAPPHDINYLVFLGKLVELVTGKKTSKALFNINSFEDFANLIAGAT